MAYARSIALSGPMGVGKSTVARVLSEQTGVPFVDVDAKIAASACQSIEAIFADEGEAGFRVREAAEIARLLESASPCIVALGGGAVLDRQTRRALLHHAILVTLHAPAATLVHRMHGAHAMNPSGPSGIETRPLLAKEHDPAARLDALIASRAEAYAEAHAQVDTEGQTPTEVAARVQAIWARDPVAVPLGARSYRVEIGHGALGTLSEALNELRPTSVLLVSDDRIWPLVSRSIQGALSSAIDLGRRSFRVLLSPGETHKTIESVERIWDAAALGELDRDGVMVAIGGGVVGDLAGFAAATWLRGVRFVQVPTTLLAMVDASVGGKTAIDRSRGKNLVGAFHQPAAVVADLDLLATLPLRDLRSGLAEVVKTALLGDADLLDRLERLEPINTEASFADPTMMREIVRESIAYKARVVAEDERDQSGARAALNFGHTVGHALEAHGGYDALTHGEAVALGMIAALRVGVALGRTDAALLERTRALLQRLGLPCELDQATLRAAFPFVAQDKKRSGGQVSFVLVTAVGKHARVKLDLLELEGILLGK